MAVLILSTEVGCVFACIFIPHESVRACPLTRDYSSVSSQIWALDLVVTGLRSVGGRLGLNALKMMKTPLKIKNEARTNAELNFKVVEFKWMGALERSVRAWLHDSHIWEMIIKYLFSCCHESFPRRVLPVWIYVWVIFPRVICYGSKEPPNYVWRISTDSSRYCSTTVS